MSKNKVPIDILWLDDVEEHDYPAAIAYLAIIYPEALTASMVASLREAPIGQFKAKDLFRASGLSLLGISNGHVAKDKKKIMKGKALSPLLLIRDTSNGKVVIADGYHRLCAIYGFNEDAEIHCKIV